MALSLCSPRGGISRAERRPGQSARRAGLPQYALGEEPLPDAHQEYDGRFIQPILAAGYGSRSARGRRLPVVGTAIAAGVLEHREVPAARARSAALDHASPPCDRRESGAVAQRGTFHATAHRCCARSETLPSPANNALTDAACC